MEKTRRAFLAVLKASRSIKRLWPAIAIVAALQSGCSYDANKSELKHFNRGESYFKQGKYESAEIEFRNAVTINPASVQAHAHLANTYLKLAKVDNARRELETAVQLDPKNWSAALQLAGLVLASQQYEQAQEITEKLLAADEGNIPAHEMLAATYVAAHDVPKAVAQFQRAIDLAPSRVENYLNLAAIYVATHRTDDAERIYRQAAAVVPKSSAVQAALGSFYFSQRKLPEAETALRAAIELDARQVAPRLALVPVYLAAGKQADAEELCRGLKALAPDNPQAYRALGLFFVFTGQKEKALAEMRTVFSSHPKDDLARALIIETLLDLERFTEAEAMNRQLLQSSPGDLHGLLFKGRLLLSEGKYSEALQHFQKVVGSDARFAVAYYYLGVAQNAVGSALEARSSWTRALELRPQMTDAQLAIAEGYADSGDYDAALKLAGDIARSNPNLTAADLIRAKALLGKGDIREGEALLRSILDRAPGSLRALSMLVGLDIKQKRSAEDLPRISQLLDQQPRNATLYLLKAKIYFEMRDLKQAEDFARRAIALDAQRSDAHTVLASIHLAQGSPEKAKQDLQASIDLSPRNSSNYMALAALNEKAQDWEQATKIVEKAYQIDSGSPQIANTLAYLYLEHGGDVGMALKLAQIAKQKMPDSLAVTDTLGWSYYKLKLPELAVTQLEECTRRAPDNPTYAYHLGMAYLAAGQPRPAERYLLQAVRRAPDSPFAAAARTALDKLPKTAE